MQHHKNCMADSKEDYNLCTDEILVVEGLITLNF